MKKLFLVFMILMVGLVGVSAIPNRPGGDREAPQSILPQDGVRLSAAAPTIPLSLSLRYTENAEFLDESAQLIVLWTEKLLAGQLSEDDFKTLGIGRIDVLKMRLLSRTASIGLIPDRFPLLC